MRVTRNRLKARHLLLALATLASVAVPLQAQGPGPAGLYDAVRYKGKPLPAHDRLAPHKGFAHQVRLEAMSVTLLPDGRFRATANYAHDYRALIDRRPLGAPLFESVRGKWVRKGNALTFIPERGKKSPPTRPVTGVLVPNGMIVKYELVTPQGEVVPLRVEFARN